MAVLELPTWFATLVERWDFRLAVGIFVAWNGELMARLARLFPQTGHVQRSCPTNPNPNGAQGGPAGNMASRSRIVCNRCLQLGHTSRNCMAPMPRHQPNGQPGAGGPRPQFNAGGPRPPMNGGPRGPGMYQNQQQRNNNGGPIGGGQQPPSNLANANVRCYVCQGYGHLQRSCPSKATLGMPNSSGPQQNGGSGEVACYYCGQVGHVQKNCPAAQSESKCFQCGLSGHVSANCTKLECFQCGGPHFARACPEKESRM